MRYPGLAIILFLFPLGLFSQESLYDTIPVSDTITLDAGFLKGAGKYTFETRVDSVNTLVINEFLASNSGSHLDNYGDDDDWFEIYNYGDEPVRINHLYFTEDPAEPYKWKMDSLAELHPDEYFLIWADQEPEEGKNHASFRLSAEGEYLAIFMEDGTLIDQRYFGAQTTNVSFGRYPDAGLTWNYFAEPTPGANNLSPGAGTILPLPTSNLGGGFYSAPQMLALYSSVAGASIFYTTDCTMPDSTDLLYQAPVEINSTTVIRARLIKEDALDGPVFTVSIIMDDTDYENPVVSMVAEPETLFGGSGIISANNSSLEATAHLEYIEGGRVQYRGGSGLQLHAPRHAKPYSLRLLARSRYGNSWFDYPFFNDKGPDRFKRLILRNSGNDNVNYASTNTHFRDPLIHTLGKVSNRNPMISESKPVNVFLNGNYHGLFNLREREDRYYIETHTGITEDYDFIELEFGYYGNIHVIEGSYDAWRDLLSFVDTTGNLSLDEDYQLVKEMVDLDNFTDYWITEVFAGNYDWISNNIKFWKPDNGKWQWLYWDTDHGLGLKYSHYGDVEWNTLYWSLTFSDRAWANGYNNILIRNLLKNDVYKAHFIRRFTQLISTSLSYEHTAPLLDSMKSLYQDDMAIHAGLWGRSMSNWNSSIEIVDDYLKRRPDTVLNHIRDFFGLQNPVPVSIRIEPPGAGTVNFSGLDISSEPLAGKFFPGMNYQLVNTPVPGFYLDLWKPFQSTEDTIDFQLTDSMDIVAFFLPSDHSFPIQICEVYANNHTVYDPGDWIEFYYYGSDSLSLDGWYLSGDNDQLLYTFSEGTIVHPGQRFIVCEDLERFQEVFPDPVSSFGNLIQGFSTSSLLSLKSGDGEIKKSLSLMASAAWPVLPEDGYSLELRNIADNTENGNNWEISENSFGSPGIPNYSWYDFHPPSGKDTVFNNHETHILKFASSQDYYQDQDRHNMAGIAIKEISGSGLLFLDEARVEQGEIYEPYDMVFSPQEPFSSSSSLLYSFIDKSGQESSEHLIRFNPLVNASQGLRDSFLLYPVPAREYCIIELPPDQQGPIDFCLFDLNGRMLQSLHSRNALSPLQIDLTGVESGMYLYLIKTRKAVVNGKIEVIK
jgi:hypothetical protein